MLSKLLDGLTHRGVFVVIILAMAGLWSWALGMVPIPGQYGFVYQAELSQKIQDGVGKDIDALKSQTRETSTKVDNIKTALDQILADYYSKRIRDGVRQRCKLPPTAVEERDRLWDQVTKDLNLYHIYSGDKSFERPTCLDV